MLKAAFIFVAPEADPVQHRSVITTSEVELITVGVEDYEAAEAVAKELFADGVTAIELCAGFGNEGVVRVTKAVDGMIPVGVVRFDSHPGFGFKSGDALFQ